ncbi:MULTISPECIES: GNAT family protein [Burkholderia]|uniref:GNAT family N-acetyltransferase n=1 Tax=Burkholderia TaxID=32008 RepID=UPI000468E936|nr:MULTISPECIES: GNAT family protein [Burkholderia]NIE87566.1 GNAT family N-acetyltransferase [Burkholderia sp. Tr-860]NIF66980.1 GNAT family N-acetyltransferase [Burkholderia sp. Cy-647]NIF74512.1 GNAT family N-acetyltransferase [Burkholderia sp. Ap-962]NIF92512.1 GNAT family N-acetyltransferase [Burkholderia sp. Cy-637]NIF98970.1 GNAT family N-acetyltransferase [Burkholderia sp. Ax-1720]
MRRLVLDQHDEVMHFVASRTGEHRYDDARSIGLAKNGELVAGVVFQGHNGPNLLMHFALGEGVSQHVITPAFVAAAFLYPFAMLGCRRVTGLVRVDNLEAQRLDENLGFVREGVMRGAAGDGTDFILYGMLRAECRFIHGRYLKAFLKETESIPDEVASVEAERAAA